MSSSRYRVLFLLSLAELLGMSLWFSATAVTPALTAEWDLSDSARAWLTMSVQIGFVAGTFFSAFFNLADILNARHLFIVSALLGAAFNGGYAEFVAVPATNVIVLPDPVSYEQAASLPTVFLPCWSIMVRKGELKPLETALVLSASSGVGIDAEDHPPPLSERTIDICYVGSLYEFNGVEVLVRGDGPVARPATGDRRPGGSGRPRTAAGGDVGATRRPERERPESDGARPVR